MARISHRQTRQARGSDERMRRGEHRRLKGGKKKQTLFDLVGQSGPEADFEFEPPQLSDNVGFRIPDFSKDNISARHLMSITKLASREFNQDVGKAKRAAEKAPVLITDRGKPAFVLMKYQDYERLLGKRRGLSELLNDEATKDLEFEPARMQDRWLRPADFD